MLDEKGAWATVVLLLSMLLHIVIHTTAELTTILAAALWLQGTHSIVPTANSRRKQGCVERQQGGMGLEIKYKSYVYVNILQQQQKKKKCLATGWRRKMFSLKFTKLFWFWMRVNLCCQEKHPLCKYCIWSYRLWEHQPLSTRTIHTNCPPPPKKKKKNSNSFASLEGADQVAFLLVISIYLKPHHEAMRYSCGSDVWSPDSEKLKHLQYRPDWRKLSLTATRSTG